MYTYPLKYKDFLGNEREEEFLFNMEPAELADWHFGRNGGMDKHIEKIMKAKDRPKLIALFRDLVDRSYGVLTEDGRYFRKSPEILKEFKSTKAYSEIYLALASDAKLASEFIKGVMPTDEELQRQIHSSEG
jgi:hypothetical protein